VLTNGSFESGYTAWQATGNQEIFTGTTVTDGFNALVFNNRNQQPNGVLSQTFNTVVGKTYSVTFDIAATGWQTTLQMGFQVTVTSGTVSLLSQVATISGQGTGIWWASKSYTFVATGTSATIRFGDTSLGSINTDLVLDNVRIVEGSGIAPTPTPSATPTPTPTPAPSPTASPSASLVNGSFESNFTGWLASGHVDVASSGASQGAKVARLNSANESPNAVLSQSFVTVPGRSYTLSFDYGVYSPVSLRQQRLQVTVQGNNVPLSQLISQSALNVTAVQYVPNVFSFIADSTVTTLTFSDVSLSSDSVDSYVDNVQVR